MALKTRDHVLRRPEHSKILIRLEEIKANFLKTVLFKTDDTESSAQQA
jgi:hypothetical protein